MLPIVSLCCVLLLAACPRSNSGATDDTLPPPPTTTTTAAPNYDVPAEIDKAYVERVMKALDHVYGEGVRHLARSRVVDEEFLKYLLAIYTERFFKLAQDAWVKDAARGLPRLAASPGDPSTSIQEVLQPTSECIVIRVERDFGPTTSGPPDTTPQRFIGLVPRVPDRDPQTLNPTPWTMSYDGFTDSGKPPSDPCRQA